MIKSGFKLSLIFFCFLFCFCAPGNNSQETIAPGVEHLHYIDNQQPWSIHILKIDLTEPSVNITTTLAFDRTSGNERLTEQVGRRHRANEQAVAAINADFFGISGVPAGLQIIDGVPVRESTAHSVFALTPANKPIIAKVRNQAQVIFKNGRRLKINGINRIRHANETILYNQYKGANTETNNWGLEIVLYFPEPFAIGRLNRGTIAAFTENQGNHAIPPRNGCVLSTHGEAAKSIAQMIKTGDAVSLDIQFPPIQSPIKTAIGGIPRIIRDGRISVEMREEGIQPQFAETRHPRTAIGFTRDERTLFMLTVDGRQRNHSAGMTLHELAAFMLRLGCYQALNLDGGGSTTMVIHDKIVNRPSDPIGERAIANGLVVLSTASLQ